MICAVDSVGLLSGAVRDVMPAVPKKSVLYQLEHILVEASSDGSQLTATDTELAISARIPADVEAPGTALVPARKLYDVLRVLPGNLSCTVDATGERFVLATPIGRYELPKLDASEFPELPRADHATTVTLAPADAQAVAAATVYAASTEDYRGAITGVKFELGSSLVAVATDGYRLSTISVPLDSASSDTLEAVVPARVVELLSKAQGDVVLAFSDTHVYIESGNVRIASQLIDLPYRQWRNAVPTERAGVLYIERDALLDAVKRVRVVGRGDKYTTVVLDLAMRTITCTSITSGARAEETLPGRYDGPGMVIALDADYLQDAVQHLDASNIEVRVIAPDKGVVIAPSEESACKAYAVVMPRRL